MGYDPASIGTLVGAKPPKFSPSDLPNLICWYKADAITGLNDGDPVSSWLDSSGNGYAITQGTEAKKPLYKTNIINGLSIVRFDGVDDYLRNTSFADFGDTYTLCIVNTVAGTSSYGIVEVSTSIINTGFLLFQDSSQIMWRGRDASANRTVTGHDPVNNQFYIHVGTNSGSSLVLRTNGAQDGTPAAYTSPNPNTLGQIDVGNLASAVFWYLGGDIAEIVIYSDTKSGDDLSDLETYQSEKYNISLP